MAQVTKGGLLAKLKVRARVAQPVGVHLRLDRVKLVLVSPKFILSPPASFLENFVKRTVQRQGQHNYAHCKKWESDKHPTQIGSDNHSG